MSFCSRRQTTLLTVALTAVISNAFTPACGGDDPHIATLSDLYGEDGVTVPCESDEGCLYHFACAEGRCLGECAVDADCAEGYMCSRERWCIPPDDPWVYVAITSNWDPSPYRPDTRTFMQGPDIDAIELIHEGVSYHASSLESFVVGSLGPNEDYENDYTDPTEVLGPPDGPAVRSSSTLCNPAADGPGFFSLGMWDGLVVVRMEHEIVEGDTIRVWEVDNETATCNVRDSSDDSFGLWLGRLHAEVDMIENWRTDMRGEAWMGIGEGVDHSREYAIQPLPE